MLRTFGQNHYLFVFKWGGRGADDGLGAGELIQVAFDPEEGTTEWLHAWVNHPGRSVAYQLTISDAASGQGRPANDWGIGELYEFTIEHLDVVSNCVLAGKFDRATQKFIIDQEFLDLP